MKFSENIKPISYIKAHASEVIRDLSNSNNPIVITQNGKAKAILQDIRSYEETQESLALLKIVALSAKSMSEGRYKPIDQAFTDIRNQIDGTESE